MEKRLIELNNVKDKVRIMKNKGKVNQIKGGKVYINDDLPVIEREKQNQIRRRTKGEKEGGKEVKIGYNRVTM